MEICILESNNRAFPGYSGEAHNKKNMKKFKVTIELDAFEINVSAKNATEAKKLAIETLKKKNVETLIRRSWPDKKKEIYVDDIS